MEALGAAASVIAVVDLVGEVSASAATLMRDIKYARGDMVQVRKDMSDLSVVLSMIAEDLDQDCPPHVALSQQYIVGIAHSCRTVLLEIDTVLRESRSRLGWVTSGKERVGRLRGRLEKWKLSLDVALEYRTMAVVHGIKQGSSRIVGDLSALERDMTTLLAKVDNIEQKAFEDQVSQDAATFKDGGFILDRFLKECRADFKIVLDHIDYQRDQDLEDDVLPTRASRVPRADPRAVPPSTAASALPTIQLKDSLGKKSVIHLNYCRTWKDIHEIIKYDYSRKSKERKEFENGRYDLYHEGQAISPESWAGLVGPGVCFDLKLWKHNSVYFTDAVGRRFDFPFESVKTWEGIEATIRQAVLNTGSDFVINHNHHSQANQVPCLYGFVRIQVIMGHYDLLGPGDTVMLPAGWEQIIRPSMAIAMRMWPSKESWHRRYKEQRKRAYELEFEHQKAQRMNRDREG